MSYLNGASRYSPFMTAPQGATPPAPVYAMAAPQGYYRRDAVAFSYGAQPVPQVSFMTRVRELVGNLFNKVRTMFGGQPMAPNMVPGAPSGGVAGPVLPNTGPTPLGIPLAPGVYRTNYLFKDFSIQILRADAQVIEGLGPGGERAQIVSTGPNSARATVGNDSYDLGVFPLGDGRVRLTGPHRADVLLTPNAGGFQAQGTAEGYYATLIFRR